MWASGITRVPDVSDQLSSLDFVAKTQIRGEHEVEVILSVVGTGGVVVEVGTQTLPTVIAVDPERVDFVPKCAFEWGNDWGHLGCANIDPGVPKSLSLSVVIVIIRTPTDDGKDDRHPRASRW